MKTLKILLAILMVTLPLSAAATIKVVTSTTDLAYFAKAVGGDLIEVSSIANPTADLHYVETRPSYMVKLKDADLVLKVGLELDMWMDRLIDGSRNSKVKVVDCSKNIKPLEVPAFKADASYGDLHRFGNPHYWLSPDNVGPILDMVTEGLSEVDPQNAETYEKNRQAFMDMLAKELPAIKELAAPLNGAQMITYHNSWPYFAEYFGIKLPGFIEKYAGVAPSPSHVSEVIDLVKQDKVKVIAMEPYFDRRIPDKIASSTEAKVIILYPSIGGRSKDESYIDWLKGNIQALVEAEK